MQEASEEQHKRHRGQRSRPGPVSQRPPAGANEDDETPDAHAGNEADAEDGHEITPDHFGVSQEPAALVTDPRALSW